MKKAFYAVEIDFCASSDKEYEVKLFEDKETALNAMTWAVWNPEMPVYLVSLYKCKGKDYDIHGERIAIWRRYGRLNEKLVADYEGRKTVEDEAYAVLNHYDKIRFETTARVWAWN